MTDIPRHPAKFSQPILELVHEVIPLHKETLVLDPFAGVGGVHWLQDNFPDSGRKTVGIELEPEWALAHKRTIIGSALKIPLADESVDVIATSPAYGNRMADHHDARDSSRRNTYRHALGRPMSDGSGAVLQWGESYRHFHWVAMCEAHRTLKRKGLHIWNVSNHIRQGQEMRVVEFYEGCLRRLGCQVIGKYPIKTRRQKQGANHHLRVEYEYVVVARRP